MCNLPNFLCQGTEKGLERKVWWKLVGRLFCCTLDGAAHDVPTARSYDHVIVW